MTSLTARLLVQDIKSSHPQLLPSAKMLDDSTYIVVLQQLQARKLVAFFHIWLPGDWYQYRANVLRKEVAA